jgi:exodeoxyribonuclease VII large subunit
MHARLREDEHLLARLRNRVTDPRFLIADKQQLLDDLRTRLERRLERGLVRRRSTLEGLEARLGARHPRAVVARSRAELLPLTARLGAAARLRLEAAQGRLGEAAGRLHALSPLAVLARGYAIASRRDGVALRAATEVVPGDAIVLRLHRGTVDATVVRTEPGERDVP